MPIDERPKELTAGQIAARLGWGVCFLLAGLGGLNGVISFYLATGATAAGGRGCDGLLLRGRPLRARARVRGVGERTSMNTTPPALILERPKDIRYVEGPDD